jgi:hypothetical protein
MPQIIVTAGDASNLEGRVVLRERINASDFDSQHFTANLLERLGWAVGDAAEAEQRQPSRRDNDTRGAETDAPVPTGTPRELAKA